MRGKAAGGPLPPKPPPEEQVTSLELLRYASAYDIFLMVMGIFGACAMGALSAGQPKLAVKTVCITLFPF